jgi:hypothetical protein
VTLSAAALLTAAEEVCLGTIGSVRTVAAGTVALDGYEGQTDEKLAAAVRVKPRIEIEVIEFGRTGAVAPMTANVAIERVTLRLVLVLTTEFELRDDQRASVRAAWLELMEALRDALCWPGNLAQTLAATTTRLVGRQLMPAGAARVLREDWRRRVYKGEQRLTGLIQATKAVA